MPKNQRKQRFKQHFHDVRSHDGKSKDAKSKNKASHHNHGFVKPHRGQSRNDSQNQPLRTLEATVDKIKSGAAFLIFSKPGMEDLYISQEQAKPFLSSDRVLVRLGSHRQILSITLTSRTYKELIGKYMISPQGKPSLFYQSRKWQDYIPLATAANEPSTHPKPPKIEDWIRTKLLVLEKPYRLIAEIIEVYGPKLPARADKYLIYGEFGINDSYPDDAVKEAEAHTIDLKKWLQHRTDLRTLPLLTIDGEDARDFDDAVHVEKKNEREWILWVAIADVSYYVTPGSKLNDEAQKRATSVYLPEGAVHMLPKALSENLCSLKPNEPRLALTCKMTFNQNGDRTHTEVLETVIESKRRATYEEVEKEKNTLFFAPHFELYRLIAKLRKARGSIDFNFPEAKIVLDSNFEPAVITTRKRLDAHRLIEEFMIAANEAVTAWIQKFKIPFIYRIHPEPSQKSIEEYLFTAKVLGANPPPLKRFNTPLHVAQFLEKTEHHPSAMLLSNLLLRSLKQAIYSTEWDAHFGLASPGYTHFTSPIRRYPDLAVHRQLKRALGVEQKNMRVVDSHERDQIAKELEKIASHSSFRERLATDAERESVRIKQTRYMLNHLGATFDATITGMSRDGLYVQVLEPFVEGYMPKEDINPRVHLEFDENRIQMSDRKNKNIYRVGQKLKVQVISASLESRQIRFRNYLPSGKPDSA